MAVLRVTKIVKQIKFEVVWGMLQAKKAFFRDNHLQNTSDKL